MKSIREGVDPGDRALQRVSLAPHLTHLPADIPRPAPAGTSFAHRLRRWPRPTLKLTQHRIRNEACALRISVAVAGASLAVREEALGNHQMKLVFRSRHGDVILI